MQLWRRFHTDRNLDSLESLPSPFSPRSGLGAGWTGPGLLVPQGGGGLKGGLDLPGRRWGAGEGELRGEEALLAPPGHGPEDNDLSLPGWALGVYKVERRRGGRGLL